MNIWINNHIYTYMRNISQYNILQFELWPCHHPEAVLSSVSARQVSWVETCFEQSESFKIRGEGEFKEGDKVI